MRLALAFVLTLTMAPPALPQAALQPASATRPTLEQARAGMNIPSRSFELRGQMDSVGFTSRADQMAKVWDLSLAGPAPDSLGPVPAPGVAAILCPHDDYLFAGRVYRKVIPLVTARRVVLVGVFHRYRRFGERDRLVFDSYRAWRSPDGPVPVSELRATLLSGLSPEDYVQDAAMHDSEHSLEALVYWLRHANPGVEIVPIIVPAASFERLEELAGRLGAALAAALYARGWRLGRDVAVAISTDGVHYGSDFRYTPYGDGGAAAYQKAVAKDRELLRGPLSGGLSARKVRDLYAQLVNPANLDEYRLTWCGRFAVPLGLLLLERVARGEARVVGHPVAYATSVGWPELPVRNLGMGATAPCNLHHFVSYPAVAFTLEPIR